MLQSLILVCLQALTAVQHTLPAQVVQQFQAATHALLAALRPAPPVQVATLVPQFEELTLTPASYAVRKATLERLVALDPQSLPPEDRRVLLGLLVREHQRYMGTRGRLVFPSRRQARAYFEVLKRAGRVLLPAPTRV